MVNQVILNNKGTQGVILANIQVNNKVIPASSMEVQSALFSCWLLPLPCDFLLFDFF
jgi:hypothetical protein